MLIGLGLAAGGVGVGVFGSLLGLGGGILIVPFLTFFFGMEFREAVGISLVCVIVTSSAGAGVYLQRHVANLRLGMLLEVFTASGALVGGLVAFALPDQLLAGLFAALLVYTSISMARGRRAAPAAAAEPRLPVANEGDVLRADDTVLPAGDALLLAGELLAGDAIVPAADALPAGSAVLLAGDAIPQAPTEDPFMARLGGPGYQPRHLRIGIGGGFFAGIVSALLGVGGGIVKVPLMHLAMGVPLKVATATSNLMIGVTAAASAIVYLLRGGIDPFIAAPTAVGVFAGAMVGTRVAGRVDVGVLRLLFVAVLLVTAAQMIVKAFS